MGQVTGGAQVQVHVQQKGSARARVHARGFWEGKCKRVCVCVCVSVSASVVMAVSVGSRMWQKMVRTVTANSTPV